jgi:hypothetical protein
MTGPAGALNPHHVADHSAWCVLVFEESSVSEPEQDGGRTRRRAPGADPEVRSFGVQRVCAAESCQTTLSRYNPDSYCSVHRGWDRQVVTRQRRAEDAEPES